MDRRIQPAVDGPRRGLTRDEGRPPWRVTFAAPVKSIGEPPRCGADVNHTLDLRVEVALGGANGPSAKPVLILYLVPDVRNDLFSDLSTGTNQASVRATCRSIRNCFWPFARSTACILRSPRPRVFRRSTAGLLRIERLLRPLPWLFSLRPVVLPPLELPMFQATTREQQQRL